jgi:hypothetical protein
LAQQVAFALIAVAMLQATPELIAQYDALRVPSFKEFITEMYANKYDLDVPENRLKFAKIMLEQVLANTKTQEFRDAVRLLS